MNISSLSMAYRYAIKVEQKFKLKKRDFGSANLKQGKGAPKPHNKGQSQGRVAQDNLPKLQVKNSFVKLKKDTGKWCEFHKSSTHKTSECQAKQSLVAKMKVLESDACSNFESEPDKGNDKGKKIINAEPNATIATTKIQKEELEDLEDEECFFHSQMWVKGSPLQFIVNSGSQKNLISAEVVKHLGSLTTTHSQPYTIRWLHQGRDLHVSQQCHLPYNTKPFMDEALCDISPLEVCDDTGGSTSYCHLFGYYKKCSKLISKTGKFVFLMIRPQGKKKTVATTSRQGPSTRQLQMEKVAEDYEDIFTSPTRFPLHCQVKHSIDLTPGALLPNGTVYRRSVMENDEIKRQIQ
eukprot:PITA_04521